MDWITTPADPNATPEARKLFAYLGAIAGKGILLGQHTKTRQPEELKYIREVTGKEPALCGFELLAYSGNINWDSCDEDCLKELYDNLGTLENALQWGRRGGIVTLTWHWYSPLGGVDKSFYARNTDFDPREALKAGTPEQKAMLRDLDLMAVHLHRFQQEHIPILWRPFHEADGDWFWWGVKGVAVAGKLFRFMYRYFTEEKGLHNLLWVWNAPTALGYPGEDVVDIISRDIYPKDHTHTSLAGEYRELASITPKRRLCAIGENGTLPGVAAMAREGIPWCWHMTWCGEFATTEKSTTKQQLWETYHHPYAITLDRLPTLW